EDLLFVNDLREINSPFSQILTGLIGDKVQGRRDIILNALFIRSAISSIIAPPRLDSGKPPCDLSNALLHIHFSLTTTHKGFETFLSQLLPCHIHALVLFSRVLLL